jgi:AraC family transcriptional regulator, regulatory protein of adaptative response / DNA-3-methyladenine glycosylase II
MNAQHDAQYQALSARDARFDGRMFVGVSSTRIYCRPVCRVRVPMQKHCHFFNSAAGAEGAGYRPCLRCRPELAPGLSLIDSPHTLATHAARLLADAAHQGMALPMPLLAAKLGVTDRHLRRIFVDLHGVSPVAYLTTQRLLFAKHLLTDTPLPITQVAMLSGFGSLRRFNAAFAGQYRLNPTALRKQVPSDVALTDAARDGLTVRLSYRPPYDVDGMLRFLAQRALPGVEQVDMGKRSLMRTMRVHASGGAASHTLSNEPDADARKAATPQQPHSQNKWISGWIRVTFLNDKHQVKLDVAPTLLPVLGRVMATVRHALDLDAEPQAIAEGLRGLPCPLTVGLRLPGSLDAFESLVRIVLGQQITVAAARTLAQRLLLRFGDATTTPNAALTRLFPSPQVLAQASADDIGQLGIVSARVRLIQGIARAVVDGTLVIDRHQPLPEALAPLRAMPGVGEWTAQLVAMRVLGWPDAWPATDVGVLNALKINRQGVAPRAVQAQAEARAEGWHPWRSYAVMQLWQSLETGT